MWTAEHRKKYEVSPERKKEIHKKWRLKHRDEILRKKREWNKNNKDRLKMHLIKQQESGYFEEYRKRDSSKIAVRERARRYRQRNKNNIHFRLRNRISCAMWRKLKNRNKDKDLLSIFQILPYTMEELKVHLEKQFKEGMSWDNYGKFGWHIDHIIPDCDFKYSSVNDEEFKKSWALKNLQPLWAKENWKKKKHKIAI